MRKPLIFISRKLPEKILNPYRERLNFEMWMEEDTPVPRSVLLEQSSKADGVISMLTDSIDEALMEQADELQIVANLAVGYDNIDVSAARKNSITVTNTPDVLTDTTADLTFGLLMTTARRIVEASNYIKDGKWENWSPLLLAGTDIHHKTIGIFGMGRIGTAVARRAKGFGMDVIYHNRSQNKEAEKELGATYVSFDELLKKSDYVVSMAPLTDQTHHIFNEDAFKKMKNEAFFINASRGSTMNEEDLYDALCNKEIAGAGLDVFENEPINSNHPLLTLDQVVCLPHIGSATVETRHQMIDLCLENIVRHFEGEDPLTPVN